MEAAEIRGCLALEKLTGLPGERRARRGVTCRILRASRPSISPLTDSRFFFLFVQWLSMFSLSFVSLPLPSPFSYYQYYRRLFSLYKYQERQHRVITVVFSFDPFKRDLTEFEVARVRFLIPRIPKFKFSSTKFTIEIKIQFSS